MGCSAHYDFFLFLSKNTLSFHVMNNYISALNYCFAKYDWRVNTFYSLLVKRLIWGLHYSVCLKHHPKGLTGRVVPD